MGRQILLFERKRCLVGQVEIDKESQKETFNYRDVKQIKLCAFATLSLSPAYLTK